MIGAAESFLSAGPAIAHFGIGAATAIESYEVRWPDGKLEEFPGGVVDQRIELRKGKGR